jgi:acetoacetate decarboxylase
MEADEVLAGAFAMPHTSPSIPRGPYRFRGREYLTIRYATDIGALRRIVPEPLRLRAAEAAMQFVRVPDTTGLGEYALAAQTVPVLLPDGESGFYVHAMFVDAHAAHSGGRELWGFPQRLATPRLRVAQDALLGTLDVGPAAVARGSMGFKHEALGEREALAGLQSPSVLLKVIPHVDGRPRILELVRVRLGELRCRGAWSGPAALSLFAHALAPAAELPVIAVLGAVHAVVDGTLDPGEVVHDYLAIVA